MGAASRMVERRLFDRLRTQKGWSYAVHADVKLVDATTLHRMFAADCLEDAAPQVTDEVIATAYEFAESGPTKAEMDDDVDRLERQLRVDDRAGIGWMLYAAECYLSGIDVEEFDEYIERRLSLERNEIRDAWRAACEQLLLCVPPWGGREQRTVCDLRLAAPSDRPDLPPARHGAVSSRDPRRPVRYGLLARRRAWPCDHRLRCGGGPTAGTVGSSDRDRQ